MKSIIIITGANGFLGNNLVRKLVKNKDYEVRALVLPNDDITSLNNTDCKIYYGDVTKIETLNEIFNFERNSLSYVIHCAAIVYIKSKPSQNVYNVNVNGTKNIVKKAIATNSKIIYVSSVHAIEEKNNIICETKEFDENKVIGIYAKTKAEAAKYVMNSINEGKLKGCIVHPSGIIGPNDYGNSHMTELIRRLTNNKLSAVVKGGYDFVDVRDVADGIINAIDKGINGETYLLTNKYITIKEIADLVSKYSGSKIIKTVLPISFIKALSGIFEMYYEFKKEKPLFTSYSLYTLGNKSLFTNEKAKKELNFQTRSIDETIKDTVMWLKLKK